MAKHWVVSETNTEGGGPVDVWNSYFLLHFPLCFIKQVDVPALAFAPWFGEFQAGNQSSTTVPFPGSEVIRASPPL